MSHKFIPLMTAGQLALVQEAKPEEFWQGRVLSAGSCVLIAGARKSHKSDFFLEMAVSAACGSIFLGRHFSRPLRVMYVQAEIRKGYLKERIETFKKSLDEKCLALVHKNLYVTDKCKMSLNKDFDLKKLINTVNQVKPDILALDPIISYADIDENSAQQVSSLLYGQLGHLQGIKPAPCIVLIHHFKKNIEQGDGDDVFLGVRGSSAWLGWYDTGIVLKKNEDVVTVHYETRDCRPPSPQTIKLNREKGQWEDAVLPSPSFHDKTAVALQLLREAKRPVSSNDLKTQLMQKLKIQVSSAYNIIGGIKNNPAVNVIKQGKNIFFEYFHAGES